jgi:hypothetical protein
MARHPYPLEALRKLRDEKAEAQASSLARQLARSEAAEARVSDAERARRDLAARAAATVRDEQERLASGGALGADLLRLTEFEAAMRAEQALLERAEHEARRQLASEREAEQRLREELTRLETEAKLVRNHEASFRSREAEVAQKAEEEAALERWNARRH